MIARAPAHEEGGRPIDDGSDSAVGGALMMAIQEIEDLIQPLIGHIGILERLRLNAVPLSKAEAQLQAVNPICGSPACMH